MLIKKVFFLILLVSQFLMMQANSSEAISNGTKYKVGAIDESSQINPNGSSSVCVNIDLPQSPYLLQPKLSLNYNSMSTVGNAGCGWSVYGVSCISKTNHNIYFDGKVEAASATTDADAAFVLDGIRLVKTSSNSNSISYETVKGQILAKAVLSSNEIAYFEVKYPNGNVGYFRNSFNGDYYLSEVKDIREQSVCYSYMKTDQGLLLTDMEYAHGRYHVKFNYNSAAEPSDVVFKNGTRYTYNYLLDNIEVEINSFIWKKYQIEYEKKNGSNLITSIGCSDGVGEELPPLQFSYGSGDNSRSFKLFKGQLTKYFPYEKPTDIISMKGKFQYGIANDGMVFYPNRLSNVEFWRHKTAFRHSQHYFVNQYSDTQEIVIANGLEDNISFDCGKITTGKGFNGIICADIDKTPGDEIIKFNVYLEDGKDLLEITAYSPSLYGGLAKKYNFVHSFNNQFVDADGHSSIYPKNFYVGDFNGDGINEILVVVSANLFGSGNSTQLYLIDVANGKILYQNEAPFVYNQQFCKYNSSNGKLIVDTNDAVQNSDRLYILDIDGDGKSEIVHIAEDGTSTYAFKCLNTSTIGCEKIYFDSALKKAQTVGRKISLAQLNSDNLPDLAIAPNAGQRFWNAYLSMGNGKFYKQSIVYPSTYETDKNYFFQDVNFDGKSDLVECKDGEKFIKVYLTDNTFNSKETITSSMEENSILIPANVSSQNMMTGLMAINNKGEFKRYLFEGNDFNTKLMRGYTNSFGVTKQFSYKNLYNSEYMAGSGAKYPYVNYKGNLLMATNFKVKTLNKILLDIDYRYQNAVIHKQGLGFKGYEYVNSYDKILGRSTSTHFDVFNDCGVLQQDDANVTKTNEYKINIGSNRIDKSILVKTTEKDKATNITKTEEFQYDGDLNIIAKKTHLGNDCSIIDEYTYQNINYDDKYILGQLINEKHEVKRNEKEENTSAYYEYENNLLKKKKSFINGYLANTEDYVYNSEGQNTSISLKSFNSSIRHTTAFEYNDKGLVSSKTGGDGQIQSFTYDELDQLKESKDFKGSSYYEYDGFGTLLTMKKNDGTISNSCASWTTGEAGSLFKVETTEMGRPAMVKFYDERGLVVREGACHFDGSYLYVDKEYDERGQVISMSQPFKHSASARKYQYVYDSFGRIQSKEDPIGNITTYSYDGLNITINENGKTTRKTYNALNDLLSVDSYKGNVQYRYDGGGRVVEETTGGITQYYTYDPFGRLISKRNPYSGKKNTSYDEEGNVAEVNDGEKSIRYNYDLLGHVTSKTVEDEKVYNYSYNSYGELCSVANENGELTKEISYDKFHRIESVKEYNGGNELIRTFSYKDGLVNSIKYQSNNGLDITENYVYQNGILTEINANDKKVAWHLDGEDEKGRASQYSALGYKVKYDYDSDNTLSAIGMYRNNNCLWKENYDFDSTTGNLLSRYNHHGVKENYEYDIMDRLTAINGHGITYDELGNIMSNEQVGEYSYNNIRSCELESLTSNEDVLSQASQKVKYNSTLQPLSIESGDKMAVFTYGEDGQRCQMNVFEQSEKYYRYKYYFGNKYEISETAQGLEERLYIGGDAYNAPVVLVRKEGVELLYQITRDYQGSIKAIYDEDGKMVEELSFDPWGRMCNPETGAYYAFGEEPNLFLDRGYTGHEHLEKFQLINMNGRLYNPILGRFLSPDPVLADNTDPQAFNSYAYALNNPLKFVDKNGKFPFLAVGIGFLVGAYIGGSLANHNFNPSKWDWNSGNTYLGMTLGGIAGAFAGYGIGVGYLGFNFTFITPVVAVGINYSTNEKGEHKWDGGYTTIAGGGFNYGIYKAQLNASKAYDNAVSTMRQTYNTIQADLSNMSIQDFVKDYFGGICSWGEKNFDAPGVYSVNNQVLKWYKDYNSAPKGLTTISCTDFGKKICRFGGKIGLVGDVLSLGYNILTINEELLEREKWECYGANIGAFIGSLVGGGITASLATGTGPIAIPFIVLGAKIGEVGGSMIGSVAGGIIYDINECWRFKSELDNLKMQPYNINNNSW